MAQEPQKSANKSAGRWIRELEAAQKDNELRKFWQRGRKVIKKYLGTDSEDDSVGEIARYNVFWANVGVLKSALYAISPKPVVKREFDDFKDQEGRVASVIMERLLRQPFEDQSSVLNRTFSQVVEDRLVPGLGQVWLRYDPKIEQVQVEGVTEPMSRIVDENVETDYVYWEDFIWSPCRTWEECRWVARRVWMSKKDFTEKFGEARAKEVEWASKSPTGEGERVTPESFSGKKTEVFEIWCKTSRIVHFISKSCETELGREPDPLELRDFFPCPRPLLATHTTSSLVPKADYMMVQSQYTRLQDLTIRIKMLEDAIQVSGAYDKANNELSQLLNGSKMNRMIAVDNWALFTEKGGIKGVIDWFPLDMVVDALDKLRELKNEAKAELYEVTGISDIMRGVSAPRETAMAQGLKAQYSSVRLQYIQGEVAEFIQESLRIKGEIISKHFQPETIIRKSMIMLTPDAELAEAAVGILKEEWATSYRVLIYADTLSIPDYNAERQGRVEFITSAGQFISQIIPLVQLEPKAAPFLAQLLQWAVASFRSAQSIEGVFTRMLVELEKGANAPKPPAPPDPKLLKANADIQAMQIKTKAQVEDMQTRTAAKVTTDRIQAESQAAQTEQVTQAQTTATIVKAVIAALEAQGRIAKQEEEKKEKESKDGE